ncbi:hypothetical protein CQA65_30730, partial [Klebsiella pneumoniae]
QWGISRCGALDKPAMTIANLLVGNAPEAAALEMAAGKASASGGLAAAARWINRR